MSPESALREQICMLAKSMFDRGLTGGLNPRALKDDQVQGLITKFDIEWDT